MKLPSHHVLINSAHLGIDNHVVVSDIHHSLICGLRPWEPAERQPSNAQPLTLSGGCRQCNQPPPWTPFVADATLAADFVRVQDGAAEQCALLHRGLQRRGDTAGLLRRVAPHGAHVERLAERAIHGDGVQQVHERRRRVPDDWPGAAGPHAPASVSLPAYSMHSIIIIYLHKHSQVSLKHEHKKCILGF